MLRARDRFGATPGIGSDDLHVALCVLSWQAQSLVRDGSGHSCLAGVFLLAIVLV